jgi:hypothetical protein
MIDIQKPIPNYLKQKDNLTKLVIFTAAFAVVFINIYSPFGISVWFKVTQWQLFFYSSLVILTGILIIVISRLLMIVYYKNKDLSYVQYALWILGEILFMALFYALFQKIILHDSNFIIDLLKVSIQNTALVLLLPYCLFWLYFSWYDNKTQLELLKGQTLPDNSQNMVAFYDEKNVLRLSLKMENLLYIEASDNYVNINYINKEKVTRFLLRNSLKSMELLFKGTEVIRSHRSYMVNFKKVKIIRKDKDGLKLEFDLPQTLDLPVSKTYSENIMGLFMNYSAAN